MINIPTARKHHYVPQFYLGNFSLSGTKDDSLWVFDKKTNRQWKASIDDIACQRNFYTVEFKDGTPDEVEKAFSKMEDIAAPIIKQIIETNAFPSQNDFMELITFIAISASRGPGARKTLAEPFEEVSNRIFELCTASPERYYASMERLKKVGYDVKDVPYEDMLQFIQEKRYTLEFHNNFHVHNIFAGIDAIIACLINRNWSLFFNTNDDMQFICPDRTVYIMPNEPIEPSMWGIGFGSPKTDLVVPLSKNTILIGRYEEIEPIKNISPKAVAIYNNYTFIYSTQYMYSTNQDIQFFVSKKEKDRFIGVFEFAEYLKNDKKTRA